MFQTTKTAAVPSTAGEPRYEVLLQERVRVGLLYVDAVCHRSAFADAERLFAQVSQLDGQLARFRRYSHDEFRVVTRAEDERWHVPGQPPAGLECRLCLKEDLAILPSMVLMPSRVTGVWDDGEAA